MIPFEQLPLRLQAMVRDVFHAKQPLTDKGKARAQADSTALISDNWLVRNEDRSLSLTPEGWAAFQAHLDKLDPDMPKLAVTGDKHYVVYLDKGTHIDMLVTSGELERLNAINDELWQENTRLEGELEQTLLELDQAQIIIRRVQSALGE